MKKRFRVVEYSGDYAIENQLCWHLRYPNSLAALAQAVSLSKNRTEGDYYVVVQIDDDDCTTHAVVTKGMVLTGADAVRFLSQYE